MSSTVNIEIDGKKVEARQGQMIIEVTDKLGITIPRFCYHQKLSIAANCRMCLVDVEKAPKPAPACATPVTEGMKIFTQSPRAKDAQKAVMEFLLINHPLDCPICDQGGQCELQDVSLEYGRDYSEYTEGKRVVKDKDIGPLISTEMTRCIHCTRCVRFGSEIAGIRELGVTGRGESTEIGTYIEKSVNSELSGNVIDLCPVGALTSKPFRFKARAWELKAFPSISPHDCVGSNLFFHTLRGKVMRTLPRENEVINEVWLSDRDRYSYEGFNHSDRLQKPYIKQEGEWRAVDWPVALAFTIEKLKALIEKSGAESIGTLASPNSTLEEFYLLQKLCRSLGIHNLDHRLRQIDTTHQAFLGMAPCLGISLNDLEQQEAIILIGSDVRKEQPIISHRIRKASRQSAKVFAINPASFEFNFDCEGVLVGKNGDFIQPLEEVIKALCDEKSEIKAKVPASYLNLLFQVVPSVEAKQIAAFLLKKPKTSVILGAYTTSHPQASKLIALSRLLAFLIEATWGEMSEGANSAGGALAGMLPHRLPMGKIEPEEGLSAHEMWRSPRQGYLLMHCEPEYDTVSPRLANEALKQADTVIVFSAYDNPHFREYADVLLPVTPTVEMAGTYVNAIGDWQRFQAVVAPLGESRPAWKVLRVMGNLLNICGFDYENVEQVLAEIQAQYQTSEPLVENLLSMTTFLPAMRVSLHPTQLIRLAPVSLYHVDGITRRAKSLQETQDAQVVCVRINVTEANQRHLRENQLVWVIQEGSMSEVPLVIKIDNNLPMGVAKVAAGITETIRLGEPFGTIELKPVEDTQK